jgi:uncharacterized protein YrrD
MSLKNKIAEYLKDEQGLLQNNAYISATEILKIIGEEIVITAKKKKSKINEEEEKEIDHGNIMLVIDLLADFVTVISKLSIEKDDTSNKSL